MSAEPTEVVIAQDEGALAALAADRIAGVLAAAAAAAPGRRVSVALAGGRTPRAAYALLARDRRVPWAALDVFLGDERCVPPGSDASNSVVLRELLAARLLEAAQGRGEGLRPEQIHPLWGAEAAPTDATLDTAARAYEALLPERLDLLLLGVGADGHCASLFPGSPALDETRRLVLPARAPDAPIERLTITPLVIAAARHRLVLVSGAEKAQAVAHALADEPGPAEPRRARALPARLARRGTWLLDRAAAAKLGAR